MTAGPASPAPVAGLDDEQPPWPAVAAAVALLTRRAAGYTDIRRADLVAGCQPGHLVRAMEAIVEAVLHTYAHPDGEAFILRELGLHVADKIGEQQMEPQAPAPASGYLHRCRWADDGPAGRCPNTQASPGARDVPELCAEHLARVESWAAARGTQRAAERAAAADGWIAWAARKAEDVRAVRQVLGERRGRRA